MSHVLTGSRRDTARSGATALARVARLARLLVWACRDRIAGRPKGRAGLLRVGHEPAPSPMVMTAVFGGRTYTRPDPRIPRAPHRWEG